MRLLLKQRLFSWWDSFDIYNDEGQTVYTVHGQPSWGHRLEIRLPSGEPVGLVQQRFAFLRPRIDLYRKGELWGTAVRELTLFRPVFSLSPQGWQVEGQFLEWDYTLWDADHRRCIAVVTKELWRMTDTYVLDIPDPREALPVLMLALVIDAEKCSRNSVT